MLTTILAAYGAIVATVAAIIPYLSYRSSRPLLSGNAGIYASWGAEYKGGVLVVKLYNRGSAPVTVESIDLYGRLKMVSLFIGSLGGGSSKGPIAAMGNVLPARIESQSRVELVFAADEIERETDSNMTRFYVRVNLSNGKHVSLGMNPPLSGKAKVAHAGN